jgi:hypothetical protein
MRVVAENPEIWQVGGGLVAIVLIGLGIYTRN